MIGWQGVLRTEGGLEFLKRASGFFLSYLTVNDSLYLDKDKGILHPEALSGCARYLLETKVFGSREEMKREAIQEYYVILPEWIFGVEA